MANEHVIGDRVQAIDELGRWDNGRVINIGDGLYTIKFDGYDESCNVTVGLEATLKP